MRWGILGLGIAGKARAQAIRDDPRATLVCGFGGDLAGAGLVAAPSATALLDQVDAVAICSPDTTHPAYVRAALAAGRHVLCEYPLTATEDDALALFAEARRLNLTLHVAHIEVMTPMARWLRGRCAGRSLRGGALRWRSRPRTATWSLAHANLARLHRLVDLFGAPTAVKVMQSEPHHLAAELQIGRNALVELELLAQEGARRHLDLMLDLSDGSVLISGEHLFDRGAPVSLPPARDLFLADQLLASAILLDGAPPLVTPGREAALLRLACKLCPFEDPPVLGLPG